MQRIPPIAGWLTRIHMPAFLSQKKKAKKPLRKKKHG